MSSAQEGLKESIASTFCKVSKGEVSEEAGLCS